MRRHLQLETLRQLQPDVGGMPDPSFMIEERSKDVEGKAGGGTCAWPTFL
jgi:hypothetical protein